MLSALLLLSLTADPTSAVLLVRKTGVSATEAAALTDKVAQQLVVPGLMPYAETQKQLAALGLKDATNCNGLVDCHAEVGKVLKVDYLVLVSVSQIASDQSLALELFKVAKSRVLENESVLLEKRGEVPRTQLESFAARVKKRFEVEARPGDAPTRTDLDPSKLPPKDEPLVSTAPAGKSHVGSIVLVGAGVVAVGVGVGLLVHGLTQRAPLQGTLGADGFTRSELTGAQATQLNDATSVELGVSGASGALGLGLIGAALALW